MAQDQDKFIVRLPEGLRDRMKGMALDNGRSMNNEVVAAIELWLDLNLLELPRSAQEVSEIQAKANRLDFEVSDLSTRLKEIESAIAGPMPGVPEEKREHLARAFAQIAALFTEPGGQ